MLVGEEPGDQEDREGRQGIRGGLVPEASAASISCAAWEDQRGRKSGLATSLRIGAPRSHAIDRGRVKGDQASSPVGLIFLGGPINAGWNKIAAANVQTSDKASSPDAWTAKAQDVGEQVSRNGDLGHLEGMERPRRRILVDDLDDPAGSRIDQKWLPDARLSNLRLFPESSDKILVEQTPGRTDSIGQFVLPVAKPDNADANVRSE